MRDLIVRGSVYNGGKVKGMSLPGDKSISQRVLLAAVLTPGLTKIRNLNNGNAVKVLIPALKQLGIEITSGENGEISVQTMGLKTRIDKLPVLNLGPSSAAARMLIGILAGLNIKAIVDGDSVLRTRPMDWVITPLNGMGADIRYLGEIGCLPVEIGYGTLKGGTVQMDIGCAQAASAILYSAFSAGIPVEIVNKVRSRDHTERLLGSIGAKVETIGNLTVMKDINPLELQVYNVPCDPSAAAFIVAAHILQKRNCECIIENVCINPTRTGFFETLIKCGVSVVYRDVRFEYGEKIGSVVIGAYEELSPFTIDNDFDFHSLIDEVPLLAAIACTIKGNSYVLNAAELIFKESNRLESTRDMLRAFGADIEVVNDGLCIKGGKELKCGSIPCFNDHRIAMTATAVACSIPGVTTILEGECYKTSFLEFIDVMKSYGFDVECK